MRNSFERKEFVLEPVVEFNQWKCEAQWEQIFFLHRMATCTAQNQELQRKVFQLEKCNM